MYVYMYIEVDEYVFRSWYLILYKIILNYCLSLSYEEVFL